MNRDVGDPMRLIHEDSRDVHGTGRDDTGRSRTTPCSWRRRAAWRTMTSPWPRPGFREHLGLDARLISVDNTQVYLAENDKAMVVAFRGSQAPTTLDGLKDWLLTNANNYLILPEGQIGTDFAAAGVGAGSIAVSWRRSMRSGSRCCRGHRGAGVERSAALGHRAQPRRVPGTPGGLAAPAELPPGARDRHLRRAR